MMELSNANRVDYGPHDLHDMMVHSALTHKDIKPLVKVRMP